MGVYLKPNPMDNDSTPCLTSELGVFCRKDSTFTLPGQYRVFIVLMFTCIKVKSTFEPSGPSGRSLTRFQ